MSSSILCIGDPHFKTSNKKESKEMCDEILKYVHDVQTEDTKKIKFAVILGDTLHTHERVNISCLTAACKFIEALSAMVHVYLLIGNHDRINENDFLTDVHPFYAYHSHSDITVVDKPRIDDGCLFVPYVEPGRFVEAIETKYTLDEMKECDFVFAHQEFKGCKMGAIVSEIGDEWSEEYPPVVTGHIHDYQRVGKNILYTGTPVQHSYGCKNDKTISLVRRCNDDEFYPYAEERIKLNVTRRVTVRMSYQQAIDFPHQAKSEKLLKRLVLTGSDGELKLLRSSSLYSILKRSYNKIELKSINHVQVAELDDTRRADAEQSTDFIAYAMNNLDNKEKDRFKAAVGECAFD